MDKEDIVTQVNLTKLLELVDEDAERYNNQYNRLLKQNRSLQKEVKDLKSQLEQYTKIQIESDYCELSKSCKLLQKYVTENDNLRKIMWESRCPHVVMGECSREHHDNCHGMAKCIEDLEYANNKYHQTLKEIKDIVETELSYDMVGNEHKHYRNYDIIRYIIVKAEEENG